MKIILHKGYGGGLHPADFERQLAEYGYKEEDFYPKGKEDWDDFLKKWRGNNTLVEIVENQLKSGCRDYTILELPDGTDYLVHDEEGNETAYFSLNGRMYTDKSYMELIEKGVLEAMGQAANRQPEKEDKVIRPTAHMNMQYLEVRIPELFEKVRGLYDHLDTRLLSGERLSDIFGKPIVADCLSLNMHGDGNWTLNYNGLPVLEYKWNVLCRGECADQRQFETLARQVAKECPYAGFATERIPSEKQIACLEWLSKSFNFTRPKEFTMGAYSQCIKQYMDLKKEQEEEERIRQQEKDDGDPDIERD